MAINKLQFTDLITTSGALSKLDAAKIISEKYKAVINLATSQSENIDLTIDHLFLERRIVYINIPIYWDNPLVEQYNIFDSIMTRFNRQKVYIHCAMNYRVSCFVYLYTVKTKLLPPEIALKQLHKVWQPNAIWQKFIEKII